MGKVLPGRIRQHGFPLGKSVQEQIPEWIPLRPKARESGSPISGQIKDLSVGQKVGPFPGSVNVKCKNKYFPEIIQGCSLELQYPVKIHSAATGPDPILRMTS
jgi:hypothetical protein